MKTLTLELTERRRRLLRNALDHWTPAVKRIRSRVRGMGYAEAANMIEPDTDLLEGTDTRPGLVARLEPQEDLFDQDEAEGPAITLEGRECRLSYYACRKHRERLLKLKKDLGEEGYDPEDLETDLEVLGETADPDEDEPSTGLIGDLDFGWEDEGPDPDQLELDARTAPAGKSSPSGSPSDDTEPSTESETESASSATKTSSPDGSDDGVETDDEIMEMVRAELEEDPDAENKALYRKAKKIDPAVEDLTLRQFHARYPLQVKRAMARDGSDS